MNADFTVSLSKKQMRVLTATLVRQKDNKMATTLRDKLATLDPDRRDGIQAEADRLYREYLTLKELRKAQDLTQVQLAQTLGIRQSTLAQMEKRNDLMLSTLRSYVQAMGGELQLLVSFPGKEPVAIEGLAIT
jgi:DNA-binding XRE family transcriptional regulator